MSEDSGSERTEQATAKRRQDFREKGQVAQSKEVATAALMTLSLLLWVFYAGNFWSNLQLMFDGTLRHMDQMPVTVLSILSLSKETALIMARLLWPIFLLTMIVGFFASFLQVGPLFTTKPFIPEMSKFNPIKGVGRMFSKRSAVELVKSLAKVGLVGAVAYNTVSNEFSGALGLLSVELSQTVAYLGNTAYLVMAKTCGILIVLAGIDYLFTRWEMALERRVRLVIMTSAFGTASIMRRRDISCCKERMRALTCENKIPVIENKPVARALYKLDIGESIPEEMFKAVAEVLAYVYSLKRN